MTHLIKIAQFLLESFLHIWPYLLVTIPLAVIVKNTNGAKYIKQAMNRNPLVAVLLATIVGAFSPFCSCGVIPVIASLLIGGVPLAPVMSFWIASPSMDPEIFFLSVGTVGLKLSVWRLVATFLISIAAGLTVHISIKRGWLSGNVLRQKGVKSDSGALSGKCCNSKNCDTMEKPEHISDNQLSEGQEANCGCGTDQSVKTRWAIRTLIRDTVDSTLMVARFMAIAFLINAIIQFYLPPDFISSILGNNGPGSVFAAALIGIPAYTSNLTSLPLIEGLLDLGMNKGAALTFLVAGPVTTLPAMSAVWGIVNRKVFSIYILISLTGALLAGLVYNLIG